MAVGIKGCVGFIFAVGLFFHQIFAHNKVLSSELSFFACGVFSVLFKARTALFFDGVSRKNSLIGAMKPRSMRL